jgi:hypothetical protein
MVPSERISWETSRTTWNKPYSRCGNSVLDAICSTRLHDFRGKHPKTPQVTEVFLKQKDDEPKKPVIWLIWGNITLCMEVVLHSSWICKFPSVSQNFLSFCLGLERCSSFAIHAFQIIQAEVLRIILFRHHSHPIWYIMHLLPCECYYITYLHSSFISISSGGGRLRIINTTGPEYAQRRVTPVQWLCNADPRTRLDLERNTS